MSTPHPSDKPDPSGARTRFLALLRAALADGAFERLVLARPTAGEGSDLRRVAVRPVLLRGERQLQFVYTHATRDVTKNLDVEDAVVAIDALIGAAFAHAHLQTTREAIELRVSRKGGAGMSRHKLASAVAGEVADEGAAEVTSAHDRAKRRFVDIGRPWLVDLGVTDADGRLVPSMARKWKQINKFVEVFDHAFATSALAARETPVRVVDFGSGKGYLTFALHDHLRGTLDRAAEVTGVELRTDLVELGNRAASRTGAAGLRFIAGDVRSHEPGPIDVMIALHACDTATDHALHLGLRAGAEVILCSPCCHKQLRPQMRSPTLLQPMLQHGIHLGQQAEMVTDSLRALLLEAEGYATQVFEFVALEHTSKNKMILAVKRPQRADRAAIEAQIREIKAFYGVREHCLETLLAGDSAARHSDVAEPA
ncbi:MAG: SAM-dependent methyltransferase [Caldimonas sp.]